MIEIGPFLAIDLDIDEKTVHEGGDLGIFETLMGHDMAPVTGGIADGKQNGLAGALRLGEGVLAPGPPVDGVVGVLEKIGTGFGGEAVSGHHDDLTGCGRGNRT